MNFKKTSFVALLTGLLIASNAFAERKAPEVEVVEKEPPEIITHDLETNKIWQSRLSDDEKLYNLTIPGTHDSTTANCRPDVIIDDVSEAAYFQCQDILITDQLKFGIRYFDIRYAIPDEYKDTTWLSKKKLPNSDTPSAFENWYCCHGDQDTLLVNHFSNGVCFTEDQPDDIDESKVYYLNIVIKEMVQYLVDNPTEFIFVAFKNEMSGFHSCRNNEYKYNETLKIREAETVLNAILREFKKIKGDDSLTLKNCVAEFYNTFNVDVKDVRGKIIFYCGHNIADGFSGGSYSNTREKQVKDLNEFFNKLESQYKINNNGEPEYTTHKWSWPGLGEIETRSRKTYPLAFSETNLSFHHYLTYDSTGELQSRMIASEEIPYSRGILDDIGNWIEDKAAKAVNALMDLTKKVSEPYYQTVKRLSGFPVDWTVREQAKYVKKNCLNKYDFQKSAYGIVALDFPETELVTKLINTNNLQ